MDVKNISGLELGNVSRGKNFYAFDITRNIRAVKIWPVGTN